MELNLHVAESAVWVHNTRLHNLILRLWSIIDYILSRNFHLPSRADESIWEALCTCAKIIQSPVQVSDYFYMDVPSTFSKLEKPLQLETIHHFLKPLSHSSFLSSRNKHGQLLFFMQNFCHAIGGLASPIADKLASTSSIVQCQASFVVHKR